MAVALGVALLAAACARGQADRIEGRVDGGGGPIARARVTLWAAGQGAPRELGATQTSSDGRFDLPSQRAASSEVLYLVATGGVPSVGGNQEPNDAIALMATLGTEPP
jgi:hypothetical protein